MEENWWSRPSQKNIKIKEQLVEVSIKSTFEMNNIEIEPVITKKKIIQIPSQTEKEFSASGLSLD